MTSGWLKFLSVLALFIVAGGYFNVPVWASASVGAFGGAIWGGLSWYQNKSRIYTRRQLNAKPFNGKLPTELGLATTTAVALEGNNEYAQRVFGESNFGHNFEDLREYAGVADNTMLELQAALVCEPANPDSPFAVAVTAGGVVLGYIPQFETESLYNFLMQHRGMARVNANIYIEVAAGTSRVELDLVRPYRVVPGV